MIRQLTVSFRLNRLSSNAKPNRRGLRAFRFRRLDIRLRQPCLLLEGSLLELANSYHKTRTAQPSACSRQRLLGLRLKPLFLLLPVVPPQSPVASSEPQPPPQCQQESSPSLPRQSAGSSPTLHVEQRQCLLARP